MQRLEVSGAVRPIYGSLGVKRLNILKTWSDCYKNLQKQIRRDRKISVMLIVVCVNLASLLTRKTRIATDEDCNPVQSPGEALSVTSRTNVTFHREFSLGNSDICEVSTQAWINLSDSWYNSCNLYKLHLQMSKLSRSEMNHSTHCKRRTLRSTSAQTLKFSLWFLTN